MVNASCSALYMSMLKPWAFCYLPYTPCPVGPAEDKLIETLFFIIGQDQMIKIN